MGTWERDKLPEGEFCGRYFGEYVGTFRALSDDEDWPFVRHGHGVWKGREGETYDGEWVDDYFHGIGKMKTQSIGASTLRSWSEYGKLSNDAPDVMRSCVHDSIIHLEIRALASR